MTENEGIIFEFVTGVKEFCESKTCIDCIFFKLDKVCNMKRCVIGYPHCFDLNEIKK